MYRLQVIRSWILVWSLKEEYTIWLPLKNMPLWILLVRKLQQNPSNLNTGNLQSQQTLIKMELKKIHMEVEERIYV